MKGSEDNSVEKSGRARAYVFVVDDEAMLLELAAVILEPAGYQVATFRDPEMALEAFTNQQPRPSLLITDYAMHSMTGMDLIHACRKIEPGLKVLLVSGTVGPDVFFNSPQKPDQFLAKPYHARQLIEAANALTGN
jgi:DNA-binding NtrC family response regulator